MENVLQNIVMSTISWAELGCRIMGSLKQTFVYK